MSLLFSLLNMCFVSVIFVAILPVKFKYISTTNKYSNFAKKIVLVNVLFTLSMYPIIVKQ